ncbi:hypothetical protein ACNKHT_28630 [Shigella flexneri]
MGQLAESLRHMQARADAYRR